MVEQWRNKSVSTAAHAMIYIDRSIMMDFDLCYLPNASYDVIEVRAHGTAATVTRLAGAGNVKEGTGMQVLQRMRGMNDDYYDGCTRTLDDRWIGGGRLGREI